MRHYRLSHRYLAALHVLMLLIRNQFASTRILTIQPALRGPILWRVTPYLTNSIDQLIDKTKQASPIVSVITHKASVRH